MKPKVMVALDVMLVQLCRLPLLCPPTPGQVVVVVGLLSIVEHPGPASVVQDVPRYFTISCSAQVSARLNINTCNGNEVTNIYLVKTLLLSPTDGCGEMYSFGLDASYLHLQGIA